MPFSAGLADERSPRTLKGRPNWAPVLESFVPATSRLERLVSDQLAISAFVVSRHPTCEEALLESGADLSPVQSDTFLDRFYRLLLVVHDEARDTVIHDLR